MRSGTGIRSMAGLDPAIRIRGEVVAGGLEGTPPAPVAFPGELAHPAGRIDSPIDPAQLADRCTASQNIGQRFLADVSDGQIHADARLHAALRIDQAAIQMTPAGESGDGRPWDPSRAESFAVDLREPAEDGLELLGGQVEIRMLSRPPLIGQHFDIRGDPALPGPDPQRLDLVPVLGADDRLHAERASFGRVSRLHQKAQPALDQSVGAGHPGEIVLNLGAEAVVLDRDRHAAIEEQSAERLVEQHPVREHGLGETDGMDMADDLRDVGEEERFPATQQNDLSRSQSSRLLDDGDDLLRRQLPLQGLPGGGVAVHAAEVALLGELQLEGEQPLPGQALGDLFPRESQVRCPARGSSRFARGLSSVHKHPRLPPPALEQQTLDRVGGGEHDLRRDPGLGVERITDRPAKARVVAEGTHPNEEPVRLVVPRVRFDDEVLDSLHRHKRVLDGLRIQRGPLHLQPVLLPTQDRADAVASPPAGAGAGNLEGDIPRTIPDERHPLHLEGRDDQFSDLAVRDRAAGVVHDLHHHQVRVGVKALVRRALVKRQPRLGEAVGREQLPSPCLSPARGRACSGRGVGSGWRRRSASLSGGRRRRDRRRPCAPGWPGRAATRGRPRSRRAATVS